MSDELNDHLIKKFNTDIGINATVNRETASSGLATKANQDLREIGEAVTPIKGLKYMGSAAVHVYFSEIISQMFFISQTQTLQDCPELLASKAFDDLRGSMMEHYGKQRQVKRSGF